MLSRLEPFYHQVFASFRPLPPTFRLTFRLDVCVKTFLFRDHDNGSLACFLPVGRNVITLRHVLTKGALMDDIYG
jgi:hypothetical protein